MQPHDHLFRAVFSEPEHAEGLLRAALPARLARQIDWASLRPPTTRCARSCSARWLIISYILQATEAPPEHLQPFFDQLGERAKEAFMTGAQMLIEQGKAEGLAKGRAEGRAEGKAEGKAEGEAKGKAELLLRLLRRKYGKLPAGVSKRLRGAASADLDRWAERVVTEASLDAVFEGR